MSQISMASPMVGAKEEAAVIKALRSGRLAQGEIVKQFEDSFSSFIGTKYAVAVSSGTAALHLSLLALDIKKGDEVITTPFSFIASANAILYTGAKPVFIDIDPHTFTIDTTLIEQKITKRTRAIIPVHLYGLPANMKHITSIAKKYDLKIIEDACQAHGASIGSKYVGSFGDTGCFSFYPTKNMTTGEGGIVTTNNKQLADTVKLLRSHGMPKRYYHTTLGYNMRMTDIGAAIGIEQLKKLSRFNKKRQTNAELYMKLLSQTKGLIIPSVPDNYNHVFHQFTIRIMPEYKYSRAKTMGLLKENQIGSEVYYPIPIHMQELYKNMGYKNTFNESEKAAKEVLSLPVHPGLDITEIKKVASLLK